MAISKNLTAIIVAAMGTLGAIAGVTVPRTCGRSEDPQPKSVSSPSPNAGPSACTQTFPILVGSATTYNYLQENAPTCFGPKREFVALEGTTDIGIQQITQPYLVPETASRILAMTAKQLQMKDFCQSQQPQTTDDSPDPLSPHGYFEVYLGTVPMQAIIGAPTKEALRRSFGSGESPLLRMKMLNLDALARWVWRIGNKDWRSEGGDKGYSVFLTTEGSATRKQYEEVFRSSVGRQDGATAAHWPADVRAFGLKAKELVNHDKPWIALGNKLPPEASAKLHQSEDVQYFNIVHADNRPFEQQLYLYGRMPDAVTKADEDEVFLIEPSVCKFLFNVLDEIKKKRHDLSRIINNQKNKFFHFESEKQPEKCWIVKTGGRARIWRYEE